MNRVMCPPKALVILFYLITCDGKTYNNYTLFLGIPVTEKELAFFKNLSYLYDVIYWMRPGSLYKPVQFTIGPHELQSFLRYANQNVISLNKVNEDIQSAFDKQTVRSYIRRNMDTFNWYSYYRLNDIYNWLRDLQRKHPTVTRLQSIGKSVEKREILALHLTLGSESNPKVIVEGGIHAREWASPAMVTFMINELVNALQSNDERLMKVALAYQWTFIPVLNPDGYEYSHTTDRLWRKNRRNSYGIDLNRNFGISFGTVGVSNVDTHHNSYCGEIPFSEPESAAIAEFIKDNRDDLLFYLAFHSYGQYLIVPYAYTTQHLDNFREVKRMGEHASEHIARRYGTYYTVGTSYDTVGYLASGDSASWAKKAFGIPYVATFELRDKGKNGFALPPEQILPTCEETMDGLKSFLKPKALHAAEYSEEVQEKKKKKIPGNCVYLSSNAPSLYMCLFIMTMTII